MLQGCYTKRPVAIVVFAVIIAVMPVFLDANAYLLCSAWTFAIAFLIIACLRAITTENDMLTNFIVMMLIFVVVVSIIFFVLFCADKWLPKIIV